MRKAPYIDALTRPENRFGRASVLSQLLSANILHASVDRLWLHQDAIRTLLDPQIHHHYLNVCSLLR